MENKRILELALETLYAQQAAVGSEISQLRSELARFRERIQPETIATVAGRSRARTPAQRRAHSERMKAIWAKRRAGMAKAPRKPSPPKKTMSTAAANKSRSEKMKAYWAKWRKGSEAKKR
jgi:hypothetical protein